MTRKILIADDDHALLTSLAVRLRSEGYEVVCAQDGYQAVEQARRVGPDVIILDVHMPAGDGFTVQDRLDKMSDFAGTPVIYLTGERSEHVRALVEAHGAFALLLKPFDTGDLLATVREAIDARLARSAA